MERRTLGSVGEVSVLTLGGGGLGQVWGPTTRQEAVATVREAVDAGIDLIDVAPGYGDGEAERVVGEAFAGKLPAGVRVSTKCGLGNPDPFDVPAFLEKSLDDSLTRMRISFADVFLLHNHVTAEAEPGAPWATPVSLFVEAVRPALEDLVRRGRIGSWGITAVADTAAVTEVLGAAPTPAAAQCVANLLDSAGELAPAQSDTRPAETLAAARRHGVGVMGIRAVQAGALTYGIDRELPPEHPIMADFHRAEPFRALAREFGESAASLAHRYALSMPEVDTVVLGVKDRAELRECVAAAAAGRLRPDEMATIRAAVGSGG
ncbi:aldo/keto reductase [Natronosporangium hydrolyticum]|uniref:Aldo/keto reductase n=1 Tax=Natronosporangium hydrolyticum TaxID=2811111 RepID=A0A895YA04_9ACTN|nr:aldo/keto reductase [Natronosporangium hydrolyticum]QSB13135.1 aldo/keto reductase [Natronosporangium hydrolyticum]